LSEYLGQPVEDRAVFARGMPAAGRRAAAGRSSACAMARSTLTDGLPAPLSICAR